LDPASPLATPWQARGATGFWSALACQGVARNEVTDEAWCVLSNHYHLALRTSVVPLWRGLHHLQCSFSRGFNRRHGRTGSLWQSRYQAKLVDESRYLAQLVTYIHLNPVRAGLARDPVDYPLGGHRFRCQALAAYSRAPPKIRGRVMLPSPQVVL